MRRGTRPGLWSVWCAFHPDVSIDTISKEKQIARPSESEE